MLIYFKSQFIIKNYFKLNNIEKYYNPHHLSKIIINCFKTLKYLLKI